MRSWTSGRGWHWVRDAVRTQLWPLPAAGVTFAVAVGVWLPQLDAEIDDNLPGAITDYLFGGGASAARAVLEAIAGSLITVTSLTFSLTVVTLQLASSQFSPRLLRTFSSDRFVQATLALFLGTFSYALTVLRTIRTAADDRVLFVPQMAVTLAFVLAIASVMALVLFLAHLVREIRVETMLANVHHDATETLRKVLPAHPHAGTSIDVLSQPGPDAVPLSAATSGFLVRVDEHGILIAAEEARAVVMIDREPGSSIVAGTPIGLAWPLRGHSLDADGLTRLQDRAGRALRTGNERTAAQDPGFGLRQLTDVATKALSPGINDPTTAIHALSHASALLCELSVRDLGPRLLRDNEQTIRVSLHRSTFSDLLELAVEQPRRYGATDPDVLARLFRLLNEVAWAAPQPDQLRAVAGQLDRLRATAAHQDFDPTERTRLTGLAQDVEQTLHRSRPAR